MSYVNCIHCKVPLQPDAPTTYVRVMAWERKSVSPSRRSGSDLVLRERMVDGEGRTLFCCETCIAQQKRGTHALQGSLGLEAA